MYIKYLSTMDSLSRIDVLAVLRNCCSKPWRGPRTGPDEQDAAPLPRFTYFDDDSLARAWRAKQISSACTFLETSCL